MAVKEPSHFDPDSNEEKRFSQSGTMTKVHHSFIGTESLLNKSVKMLDRPATKTSSDSDFYFIREYAILSELILVANQGIPGVYVVPSAKSELVWFGVIFVRSGMYKGGIFRFVLYIPETFPNCSHPRLFFESKVFHPSVSSETLELNLKSAFLHWTKGFNRIWQVLDFTRSIFYQISVKSATNKSASQLYENNKEEFLEKVRECVEESKKNIYLDTGTDLKDDGHYLKFEEYKEELHGEALRTLKLPKSKRNLPEGVRPGLSWVKPGTFKPCSISPYF